MSIDYDYYLTTKHREDSEKIKAHLIELLKQRLSVDVLNHIYFTNINRDNRFGIHCAFRGPAVFEVSDSVEDTASFFPDIQMRFEIGLNGPVDQVYVSKNGEFVEIRPWLVFVHASDSAAYTKLLDIINAKDLPEMKQYQKEYSVCWEFYKETGKEQTKYLLEEISRQLGDIKLLIVFCDYCTAVVTEKYFCIWLCSGKWRSFNYELDELLGAIRIHDNIFDKMLCDAEIKDYEKTDDIKDDVDECDFFKSLNNVDDKDDDILDLLDQ